MPMYDCRLMAKDIVMFETMSDLLNSNGYQLYVLSGTAQAETLKSATSENDPVSKDTWDKFLANNPDALIQDAGQVAALMKDPKSVYLSLEKVIEDLDGYPCEITASRIPWRIYHLNYGFPKQSPYIDLFKSRIGLLTEVGVFDRELKDIQELNLQKQSCQSIHQPLEFEEIAYDTIGSVFIILLLGMVGAISVIAIELAIDPVKRRF